MIIVLIRRSVRPDKEQEFLNSYVRDKPTHPDFIEETLTKLASPANLPEGLRSFETAGPDCITYLNIAKWKSAKSFADHFDPKTIHDPTIETADRVRAVFDVVDLK